MKFLNKKGQGLSISTIVVAALALLVLVVLVLIFTGRMGIFTGGVQTSTDCTSFCTGAGYTSGDTAPEGGDCGENKKVTVSTDQICCCAS